MIFVRRMYNPRNYEAERRVRSAAPAMTVDAWLEMASADAARRGLAGLRPLLEGLAAATRALRRMPLGDDAQGGAPAPVSGTPAPDKAPSR
jgi:hypothetical protein